MGWGLKFLPETLPLIVILRNGQERISFQAPEQLWEGGEGLEPGRIQSTAARHPALAPYRSRWALSSPKMNGEGREDQRLINKVSCTGLHLSLHVRIAESQRVEHP